MTNDDIATGDLEATAKEGTFSCVQCQKHCKARLTRKTIPHYKDLSVASFTCGDCKFQNTQVPADQAVQDYATVILLSVCREEDMQRQLVKSEFASIKVPELELCIPAKSQPAEVTTVRSLFTRIGQRFEKSQDLRQKQNPAEAERVHSFLGKLKQCLGLKEKWTMKLNDPTGNCFIQNPNPGKKDERCITTHYCRTGKEKKMLGLLSDDELEMTEMEESRRSVNEESQLVVDLPIPNGSGSSQILDESMIRQIVGILPARAEGYSWVNIYNTEKHGYSLATFYRNMADWSEEMSPVILILRDTHDHVFGAICSGAIRPADHYQGTGDSSILWRFTGEAPHTRELRHYTWTGDNQFFLNAAKDSLSMGAGGGHYGLWLDADLNHGRSQRCATFDNEPLAGDNEDFIVQFCEAYGFRI